MQVYCLQNRILIVSSLKISCLPSCFVIMPRLAPVASTKTQTTTIRVFIKRKRHNFTLPGHSPTSWNRKRSASWQYRSSRKFVGIARSLFAESLLEMSFSQYQLLNVLLSQILAWLSITEDLWRSFRTTYQALLYHSVAKILNCSRKKESILGVLLSAILMKKMQMSLIVCLMRIS